MLTSPSIKMQDGYVNIPQGPGLGIEVDENVLREFSSEILI